MVQFQYVIIVVLLIHTQIKYKYGQLTMTENARGKERDILLQ